MSSDDNIGQAEVLWWPEGGKLIFLSEEATAGFWDQHWDKGDWKKRITSSRDSWLWPGILRKYLPDKNSRILEGGCGCGHLVDAMSYWGYDAVGKVMAGNYAAIGANCVVTKDVPENAVVVGVPGKVISYKGSVWFVKNTDY